MVKQKKSQPQSFCHNFIVTDAPSSSTDMGTYFKIPGTKIIVNKKLG